MAVIGCIILGIIIFLITILVLILFFPVSYSVEGRKDLTSFLIKARISWLFGLFRILFSYPEPGKPVMKIAFFTLKNNRRSNKKQILQTDSSGQKMEDASTDTSEENPQKHGEEQSEKGSREHTGEHSEDRYEDRSEEQPREQPPKRSDNCSVNEVHTNTEKGSRNSSTKTGFETLKNKFNFYYGLWQEEETRTLLKDLFIRVCHILKNLFPRKIKGNVLFGASSPDITGYALAVYSVICIYFPKRFQVSFETDFENAVLEGDILVKGHVTVFFVLLDGLRILLDKRMRRLIKKLK